MDVALVSRRETDDLANIGVKLDVFLTRDSVRRRDSNLRE